MKSIKVSEDTYKLLTEIGKYKETMDEIIYKIAQIYQRASDRGIMHDAWLVRNING